MFNSTIIPRNKKCKCGCGREGRIWSKGMLKECYFRLNPPKPISKLSKKRESELLGVGGESMQNLIADLDVLTSKIVRIKNCDVSGFVDCFVCGIKGRNHWTKMDNSHYIDRRHLGLRFDISTPNCTVSCKSCNNNHNTDKAPYTNALESLHKGITTHLIEQSHLVHKFTLNELIELRKEYTQKLNYLQLKFIKK